MLSNEVFSASVRWQQTDLASDLAGLDFAATDLVTGSALLDLTSANWLDQLAALCMEHHCASLFVLNYDGLIQWQPTSAEDVLMRQRLNRHQLNDKGFGNALGPQAGHYLAGQLQAFQHVTVLPSNWVLSDEQHELQAALIKGWTEAAIEQDTGNSSTIEQWRSFRDSQNEERQSCLTVGHTDLLAFPMTDA